MATLPVDVKAVRKYIDRRLDLLEQSKRLLSLATDSAELLLKDFTNVLSSFNSLLKPVDVKFFKTEMEKLYTDMIQPIPWEDMGGIDFISSIHGKFKLLTQAAMSNDQVGNFFHHLIKEGNAELGTAIQDFKDEMDSVKADVDNHVEELRSYLDEVRADPEKAIKAKLGANSEEIYSKAENMYLNIVKTYNSLKTKKDFSNNVASSISSAVDEIQTLMGTVDGKNTAVSLKSFEGILSKNTSLESRFNSIFDHIETLKNADDNFLQNVNYGDLLDDSFKQILSKGRQVLTHAKAIGQIAEGGDINKIVESVASVTKTLPFIKGIVENAKTRNLTEKILEASPNKAMFDAMKTQLQAIVKPEEQFKRIKNDIQALVATTKNSIEGIFTGDNVLVTLKDRINSNISDVKGIMDTVTSALDGFSPEIGSFAKTALAALKKVAPTPLQELMRGDAESFAKSLLNPNAMTEIGRCQEQLSQMLREGAMTTLQTARATVLMNFVNGEYTRELMAGFLNDRDLQKSIALKGINSYVEKDLKPIKNVLEAFVAANTGGT